jgi:hypothetical protein
MKWWHNGTMVIWLHLYKPFATNKTYILLSNISPGCLIGVQLSNIQDTCDYNQGAPCLIA